MNKLKQYGALAVFVGAGMGVAHADLAETKGGIKIKTDDGRFEASVGGRVQFDLFVLSEDDDALAVDGTPASAFGSGVAAQRARSSTYFRRVYLTLRGKAYGWSYKIEPDFAGNSTNNTSGSRDIAFQDMYISHPLGPGEIIIGQIKPFRGMEELTSSNDITMMERPFASAAGIFAGGSSREFQQGLFYRGEFSDFAYGAGVFDLRRDNTRGTEGVGFNGRVVFAPFRDDGATLHMAVSYSEENPHNNDTADADDSVGTSISYAGRRGPSVVLGTTTGGEHAGTIGGELAGTFGPATLQAEYMLQSLDQIDGADPGSQDVEAFYVQASYFLTGESKPYKKADGVFGQPKPKNEFGAVELAVRFDQAKNKDSDAGCNVTFGTPATLIAATECKAQLTTVGVNWYVNPNVRFMFDYLMGENDRGFAKDKPDAFTARAQFSF